MQSRLLADEMWGSRKSRIAWYWGNFAIHFDVVWLAVCFVSVLLCIYHRHKSEVSRTRPQINGHQSSHRWLEPSTKPQPSIQMIEDRRHMKCVMGNESQMWLAKRRTTNVKFMYIYIFCIWQTYQQPSSSLSFYRCEWKRFFPPIRLTAKRSFYLNASGARAQSRKRKNCYYKQILLRRFNRNVS